MRTRSPKRRKGVRGAPSARVSSMRRSATQLEPMAASALETVPRADDCAGRKPARARGMRDELAKVEVHGAAVRVAAPFASLR